MGNCAGARTISKICLIGPSLGLSVGIRPLGVSSIIRPAIRVNSGQCIAPNYPFLVQKMALHEKARCVDYPVRRGSNEDPQIKRFQVPDDKVDWSVEWPEYSPTEYTAPFVLTASWADPPLDDPNFKLQWNILDGDVNRASHSGDYLVANGVPHNPQGRTGLVGRGILGRWGPNHAADPIVTRWKRDADGKISVSPSSGRQILEFVAIERKDGGGWAIPGGMVDPGETVSTTLKREFLEEAMDSTGRSESENAKNAEIVDEFFKTGTVVYKGYVDDPRNTDNSWMETVASIFHDETGDTVGSMPLKAGDDARNLQWQEICAQIQLYASHKAIIEKAVRMMDAHWQ